ncbi:MULTISPECIES: pyridoxamine 5'-phosphate oxidase family protein [Streptomyces]|uniref:pyridoxamine 5'-phosphate oxidase family protein n=1 Tax=Streptomyces TaxID=1883 RepID=UPI00051790CA|nr:MULTISPECIES: pyridoxamine 5'-phosphate oxidase family protein [Streptomyces]MCX4484545.1 pyridoxamine 5'-phosphate oxidase family protein [Streptomyces anulatus]MCX4505215.1 pyridoxamine 5'-phosphate oxidase family protein [Streptomyces anulatus]MCX4518206.1 pyridoxamine 5'-phosphate oxidase family protein [Streptomyces anulatus]MCX4601037.1 pyridoxamine 5'-phosphate oxidase family protein [Streptomyces anulatus]WSI77451.1 pyridoxamine 5'-phosphate oxidase family protein [Streptomyces anul
MTEYDPARSREQRKQDTLDRLRQDDDAWVATASPDGVPTLVPLSFLWDADTGTLVMATRRTNPTAVNVTPGGLIRITLGPTRDVVLIEGEARILEGVDVPSATREAFATKLRWNPRAPFWVFLRITPHTVRAWREVNELADRDLMLSGTWLV